MLKCPAENTSQKLVTTCQKFHERPSRIGKKFVHQQNQRTLLPSHWFVYGLSREPWTCYQPIIHLSLESLSHGLWIEIIHCFRMPLGQLVWSSGETQSEVQDLWKCHFLEPLNTKSIWYFPLDYTNTQYLLSINSVHQIGLSRHPSSYLRIPLKFIATKLL